MSSKIIFLRGWNKLRFYFSFLLLAFYLTLGFLFLFSETWVDMIPKGRAVIGLILVLFAALRFYVAYRRYKYKNTIIKNIGQAKKEDILEASQHATIE